MTNSEQICSELGKLYFFKELEKSDLLYTVDDEKQERELADIILRVGNYILTVQIKEMEDVSKDINRWIDKKVYKVAKNQTKETYREIFRNIRFKNPENEDILENIEKCEIIPIIIFDIKDKTVEYKRIYETQNEKLVINIFELKDFKMLCEKVIAPMEMIRYIIERKEYIKYSIITIEKEEKLVLTKTNSEGGMIEYYYQKYDLDQVDKNKLIKFNTYLSLYEKHCINNKEQYKIMIKTMSQFLAHKISCFIERLDMIVEMSFKKQEYCNSYMIDDQQSVLFMTLPKEKFDINFVDFISNLFMHKFNIKNVLTIISYAIDNDKYELDFALVEYDYINKKIYEEALKKDYANLWNTKLTKKC